MKQIKLTSLIMSILATMTTLPLAQKVVMAQATVSGASVHFIPDPLNPSNNFIQTISGSISIPTGSFIGPTTILPLINISGSNINGNPTFDLLINPGGINLSTPIPVTLNQAAAQQLNLAANISDRVSIIRANANFLQNPSTDQAIASGATTLSSPNGLIQTASAEVSLPIGLLFLGFDDGSNTGSCNGVSGCIKITPFIDNFTMGDPSTPPVIKELTIDPGPVGLVGGAPFDLATTAASLIEGETNLSNIVSLIRAVSDANGVASPQIQARAMGAITVQNSDGTTISVSGEIALPAGLYFATGDPLNGAILPIDCVQSGGLGCMSVIPEYELLNVGGLDFVNVDHLTVNPGQVQPGDPSSLPLTGLNPASTDLNASAAFKVYERAGDITKLSDLVSVIRAGAGANGLTPGDRPTARASGSATIVLPNGATQSMNGEMNLSNSLYFQGGTAPSGSTVDSLGYCTTSSCLVVNPDIAIDTINVNNSVMNELVVDPGVASVNAGWNFDAAAGYALTVAGTLEEQVSIIRAGAGNGLE